MKQFLERVRNNFISSDARRRARKMDPAIREAIAMTAQPLSQQIEEIENEIRQAKHVYEESLAKEVFIGQRINKYRSQLEERPEKEAESCTEEEKTLQTVIEQHKAMIVDCERMRRRIEDLEDSHKVLKEQHQEVDEICGQTLGEQTEPDEGSGADPEILEAGRLTGNSEGTRGNVTQEEQRTIPVV